MTPAAPAYRIRNAKHDIVADVSTFADVVKIVGIGIHPVAHDLEAYGIAVVGCLRVEAIRR